MAEAIADGLWSAQHCPKRDAHAAHVWGWAKEAWGKRATPLNSYACSGAEVQKEEPVAYELNHANPDPNYAANRAQELNAAIEALSKAKLHLDNALRGTGDNRVRTAVSTAYNLTREASDLVLLTHELGNEFE